MQNNNNIINNKGVYYLFGESRNVIFNVRKVEVEFEDERDLIKKLIMFDFDSESEMEDFYKENYKVGIEEMIDDIINDDGVKEYGYMLSEEMWGCDEETFEREYKKLVNINI